MRPERAAQIMAEIGALLLVVVLFLRGTSLVESASLPTDPPLADRSMPYLGNYSFEPDGNSVNFVMGLVPNGRDAPTAASLSWYTYRVSDGLLLDSIEPVVDIKPFVFQNNQIFLLVGDGTSLATGSPVSTTVTNYALSPDGTAMAFSASQENGRHGLYIKYASGELAWLGEDADLFRITDLAWSPDGEHIAFIAPSLEVNQLFRIERGGSSLVQLTSDPTQKSSPVWLSTSDEIAFISAKNNEDNQAPEITPEPVKTPPGSDEALTDAERVGIFVTQGENPPLLLVGDLPESTRLVAIPGKPEIAYASALPDWEHVSALTLLDPQSGTQRRAYPPLSVDAIACPDHLVRNSETNLVITITNTSSTAASLPLILRADAEPLSLLDEDRTQNALHIESIDLAPGQTRDVAWTVRASRGLATYVSALVDRGGIFPMSEKNCRVPNTYLGLPNLDYIPLMLPLLIPGLLLVLPWIRQKKKHWLWAAVPGYILIVALIILIESRLVL